jgi:hypothetical protein
MRSRIAALTVAVALFLAGVLPASAAGQTAAVAAFQCTATVTLTQGTTVLYHATSTFSALRDLSASVTRSSTFRGKTVTLVATVVCTR